MSDTPWMDIAKSYYGLKEAPGQADNPEVVKLYALAGHPEVKHDEVAWCAAFVGACLEKAGIKGTGSLWARDYEKWGTPLPGPVWGCIGVKKRAGPIGSGHVGFVVGANSGLIFLLAGNQNDSVNIASFPRSSFTAFRWPSGIKVSLRSMPVNVAGANTFVTES